MTRLNHYVNTELLHKLTLNYVKGIISNDYYKNTLIELQYNSMEVLRNFNDTRSAYVQLNGLIVCPFNGYINNDIKDAMLEYFYTFKIDRATLHIGKLVMTITKYDVMNFETE